MVMLASWEPHAGPRAGALPASDCQRHVYHQAAQVPGDPGWSLGNVLPLWPGTPGSGSFAFSPWGLL